MAPDREERNRVLGVPIGPGQHGWVGDEEQRVLGFPADWFRLRRRGRADRKGRGTKPEGDAGESGRSSPDPGQP